MMVQRMLLSRRLKIGRVFVGLITLTLPSALMAAAPNLMAALPADTMSDSSHPHVTSRFVESFTAEMLLASSASSALAASTILSPSSTAVSAVSSSVEPIDWLVRMSQAFKALNYRGTFTYEQGRMLESLRVIHKVDGEGIETERLYHLNGPLREVIRKGHSLTCVHPGDQILRLTQSRSTAAHASNLQELSHFYRLGFTEGERVADRDAVRIDVVPKDSYRYGYSFWLDSEVGILLKSLLLSSEKRILERFQFVTIEVDVDIRDEELTPKSSNFHLAQHHDFTESDTASDLAPITVDWVPQGFTRAAQGPSHHLDPSSDYQALMYTDGLATFTIFLEQRVKAVQAPVYTQKGGTIAYTRSLQATDLGITSAKESDLGFLVTIVGEIPVKTAERVANSIRYVTQSQAGDGEE